MKIKSEGYIKMIWGTVILCASFLLFYIQPLINKKLLPYFGSSASTWSVVIMFFQVFLFLGYLYAYFLSKKNINFFHLIILAICFFIPLHSIDNLISKKELLNPALEIATTLIYFFGLPTIILSANSVLQQKWFSLVSNKSPYFLYSISNLGSLIALLIFPFINIFLPIKTQFSIVYIIFAIFSLMFLLTILIKRKEGPEEESIQKLNKKTYLIFIPFLTNIFLLSLTEKISTDISPIPLFWIIPLSLFLISFILAFSSSKKRTVIFTIPLFIFSLLILTVILGNLPDFILKISLILPVFFYLCLLAHSFLYKLRPKTSNLAHFYLLISLGGALGGIFQAILAPLLFKYSYEFFAVLILLLVIVFEEIFRKNIYPLKIANTFKKRIYFYPILISLSLVFFGININQNSNNILVKRNFYGVAKVQEAEINNKKILYLISNGTIHGSQILGETTPTSYYDKNSGLGLALKDLKKEEIKIGVVGMGVGTIASYAEPKDSIKFYEIDKKMIEIAQNNFTFLKDCPAKKEIVLGDARISLQKEERNNFDVLVIDAFSGDSIPSHLMTKEAFNLYFKHLKKDGLLAIHISNNYLDFQPLMIKMAKYYNKNIVNILSQPKGGSFANKSTWSLMSSYPFSKEILSKNNKKVFKEVRIWADDYSNIFSLLKI